MASVNFIAYELVTVHGPVILRRWFDDCFVGYADFAENEHLDIPVWI